MASPASDTDVAPGVVCAPLFRPEVSNPAVPLQRSVVAQRGHASHAMSTISLESIYRKHHRFVWRSARRMGVPDNQIEDAVQDVFVVVSRRLESFKGRSSMRTWLFGIVFRVAAEHRRNRARGRRREAPAVTKPLAADERLAHLEAVELFERLLEELAPEQRAVFVLVELEQMPLKEIAAALGANINTINSRLRLAREKMNRKLTCMRAHERRIP